MPRLCKVQNWKKSRSIRRRSKPILSLRQGAVRPGKKVEADVRRCLGRSRGGLTAKVHAAMDGRGRLLKLILTPGHAGDVPQDEKLLELLNANHVLADAAYNSDAICHRVKRMWAKAIIKPKANRKVQERCVKSRYKHRNIIERFFGVLKRLRSVATRYKKGHPFRRLRRARSPVNQSVVNVCRS